MNGFINEPAEYRKQELLACERVINSGWYILGKELESFEKEWAKICNTKYAVGVANGMDAIEIALRTLDISKDDEVITTSMTAFATVLAIIRAGAIPVLADINPDTGILSLDSVKRCISKKTKAIVLVHLYGQITNMDDWQALTSHYGIHLIEDCAQSHLAEWKGQKTGEFGIVGAFSFYPTKNLGAFGDAGAIVTSSQDVYKKALRLRNYGQSKRYYHTDFGLNSRLDEIQAAILCERLKYLVQFTEKRKNIAAQYQAEINHPNISLMKPPLQEGAHVYHLYVIKSKNRDALHEFLKNQGIETFIHYPVPVHQQSITRSILKDPVGLRNAEEHANSCLSIPCHPQMLKEDVRYVINKINSFQVF